jgi:alcohol dehydrogenase class IV
MLNLLPRIIFPSEVVVKKGSIIRLKYLDGKRGLLICGANSFAASENYQKVVTYLSSAKFEVNILKMLPGDPTFASVNNLLAEMKAFNPDTIVAIGGGAVMDVVKMAKVLFENDEETISCDLQSFSYKNTLRKTQLVLIPTTCGSGSEASSVVVLKETDLSKKIPYVSHSFIPDIVILDPVLLITLPAYLTASTAIDALTHALESFTSKLSNSFSESHAKSAAYDIRMNLEGALNSSNQILYKEKLQIAAFNAGIAQNITSVGASHAIAHSLGAYLNIPHGIANGILLSAILNLNSLVSPKVLEILKFIGFNELSEFDEWLTTIQITSCIPRKWGSYLSGESPISIEEIALTASEDVCMKTNPRKLSLEEINNVLQETM